jgi:hypothetical protein
LRIPEVSWFQCFMNLTTSGPLTPSCSFASGATGPFERLVLDAPEDRCGSSEWYCDAPFKQRPLRGDVDGIEFPVATVVRRVMAGGCRRQGYTGSSPGPWFACIGLRRIKEETVIACAIPDI